MYAIYNEDGRNLEGYKKNVKENVPSNPSSKICP